MKIPSYIYQRVAPCCVPPFFMKSAYFDYTRNERIFVLWPLNYLVSFAWWLNLRWSCYCGKRSWIDIELEKRFDRRFENISEDNRILRLRVRILSDRVNAHNCSCSRCVQDEKLAAHYYAESCGKK